MLKLLRKKSRGFTLIELMIVVVIIGILASLAIYGVTKYVASAKTAEARNSLGAISKAAVAAYEGERMAGDLLAVGGTVGSSRRLCGSATNTVPASQGSIQGLKYQSGEAEWNTGSDTVGWKCLRFDMKGPQYFMYSYTSNVTTASTAPAADDAFTATANGDLDGDTNLSTFSRSGLVVADANAPNGLTLTLSPTVLELNPEE